MKRLLAVLIAMQLIGGIVAAGRADSPSAKNAASQDGSRQEPRGSVTAPGAEDSAAGNAAGGPTGRTPATTTDGGVAPTDPSGMSPGSAPPGVPKPPHSPLRYGTQQHPDPENNPVPLQVESATCATLGDVLTVTIISEADVDVAAVIGYSDGKGHESQALGTTGDNGRLVLDMPIATDAPEGPAWLMVVAGAADGRRNHNERQLQIVKATGSCP